MSGGRGAPRRRKAGAAGVGLLALVPWLGLDGAAERAVEEGNALYGRGDYPAALDRYAAAAALRPGAPEIAANEGNAWFRRGELDRAEERYTAALGTGADLGLRGLAKYNIGVVKLEQAREPDRAAGDALRLARAAAREFRESLGFDPGRDDARHNLEVAVRLARTLADKLAHEQGGNPDLKDDTSFERGTPLEDLIRNASSGRDTGEPDQSRRGPEMATDRTPDQYAPSQTKKRAGDAKLPVAMNAQAAAQLTERLLAEIQAGEARLEQRRRSAMQAPGEREPW